MAGTDIVAEREWMRERIVASIILVLLLVVLIALAVTHLPPRVSAPENGTQPAGVPLPQPT